MGCSVDLILTIQGGASAGGHFEIFREGNWLHIDTTVEVSLAAYAQTGAGFGGNYKFGNECVPKGLCNIGYHMDPIVLGIEAVATLDDIGGISFNLEYEIPTIGNN